MGRQQDEQVVESCSTEEVANQIDSKEVATVCAIPEEDRKKETKDATEVLGLKVAPLQLPMERRLQTFAVFFWMGYFLSSGLLTVYTLYYLFRYTSFWPITVAYLTWLWWDRDTMQRGGRKGWTVKWARNWRIWKWYADYFPIKLVKTAELDPSRSYLLGSHPHGVLCSGAVSAFATEGCGWSETFPGLESHLLTLMIQFLVPGHRELVYWLGGCAASKRGMESLLKIKKGIATVLVPGGARESLNGEKDEIRLVLRKRKGFIKLAIRHGVPLVPTFSFGEQRVYDLWPNPEGSFLRRLQDWFLAKTGVPLFFYFGRGIFQYSWGIVPHRTPIHVVIGAPIDVEQVDEPSQDDVDKMHQKYIDGLCNLYKEHVHKYGNPDVKLVIT